MPYKKSCDFLFENSGGILNLNKHKLGNSASTTRTFVLQTDIQTDIFQKQTNHAKDIPDSANSSEIVSHIVAISILSSFNYKRK